MSLTPTPRPHATIVEATLPKALLSHGRGSPFANSPNRPVCSGLGSSSPFSPQRLRSRASFLPAPLRAYGRIGLGSQGPNQGEGLISLAKRDGLMTPVETSLASRFAKSPRHKSSSSPGIDPGAHGPEVLPNLSPYRPGIPCPPSTLRGAPKRSSSGWTAARGSRCSSCPGFPGTPF